MERMFDTNSFDEVVTDKDHARSCVRYLASNELNFRKQLDEEGLSYDEIQEEVKKVWISLLKACDRVGFSDAITREKKRQYKL